MDKLVDLLKWILNEKGCFALFALGFSAVIFGWVGSPLTENKTSLEEVKRELRANNDIMVDLVNKLIMKNTAGCANNAIDKRDRLALAICTEDSASTQKFLIERASDSMKHP